MHFLMACGLLTGLIYLTACQSNQHTTTDSSARPTSVLTDSCGAGIKPVKMVQGQTGTIVYNQSEQRYAVVVTIPNTIDAQDVGFVCDLPATLQVEGLKVTFDGQYRPYDKTPKVMTGGQSFYYLVITKLHAPTRNS